VCVAATPTPTGSPMRLIVMNKLEDDVRPLATSHNVVLLTEHYFGCNAWQLRRDDQATGESVEE
jgi:hypothetical protein